MFNNYQIHLILRIIPYTLCTRSFLRNPFWPLHSPLPPSQLVTTMIISALPRQPPQKGGGGALGLVEARAGLVMVGISGDWWWCLGKRWWLLWMLKRKVNREKGCGVEQRSLSTMVVVMVGGVVAVYSAESQPPNTTSTSTPNPPQSHHPIIHHCHIHQCDPQALTSHYFLIVIN